MRGCALGQEDSHNRVEVYGRFEPSQDNQEIRRRSSVGLERCSHKAEVEGSIPSVVTIFKLVRVFVESKVMVWVGKMA